MSTTDPAVEWLLEEALGIEDPLARQAWLVQQCGDDLEQLEEIRSLIEASEKTVLIDTPLQIVHEGRRMFESLDGITVGPFQIVRKLGVGGMGAVYLAQQQSPVKRLVAVKLIQQARESRQILARFKSEQQILANMEHPNIARIIDAGSTATGFHYIAMEYVQGQVILEYCSEHGIDVRGKLELMLQCCRAIQHAHQRGIIHRDLKPSNVMVTTVDGKPVVKVIDFGIAKAWRTESADTFTSDSNSEHLGGDRRHTNAGVSPGTPRFMSPEQYASNADRIDTRSDIYSSGALLYNLLTGFAPFDNIALEDLSHEERKQVVHTTDPMAPSRRTPVLARKLRGDLDAIVSKAMQRDPELRYASMEQLHEDLQAYLRDRPVQANARDRWLNCRKFAARNKIQMFAGGLAILGLLTGLVISVIQRNHANRSEKLAQQRAYNSDMLLASMAISRHDYSLPKELLGRYSDSPQRIDWRFLASQIPENPETLVKFNTKIYFGLAIPSTQELACGCKDSHLRIISQTDRSIRLDIDTEQGEINGLALSPDGKTIATGGDNGTVKFWDLSTGGLVREFRASQGQIFQVAWTPDGTRFVTVGNDPNAYVWSMPELRLERTLETSGESLECLHMNRQGQLAFGSGAGVLRIAEVLDSSDRTVQKVSASLSRNQNVNRCSSIAFSPSGNLLAVGQLNGYLVLLKRIGQEYRIVERIRFPTSVTAAVFDSDETKLVLGEDSGAVHMMSLPEDWPTRSRIRFTRSLLFENANLFNKLDADPSIVWEHVTRVEPPQAASDLGMDTDHVYIEFDQPLKRVLSVENFIREWMDDSGRSRAEWNEIPKSVIFKADGIDLKFENRHSGWSDLNDLQVQGRLRSWSSHSRRVASIEWSEEKNLLYSFSEDGTVKAVRADTASSVKIGGGGVTGVWPLDEQMLAVGSTDEQLYVASYTLGSGSGNKHLRFPEAESVPLGIFCRDGKWIYYCVSDGRTRGSFPHGVHRWNPDTGIVEPVAELPNEVSVLSNVGVIGTDKLILLAAHFDSSEAEDSQIGDRVRRSQMICWDSKLRRRTWETPPHSDTHHLAKLSPDGRYASYVREREVYLVDTRNGQQTLLGRFPELHVSSSCFSSDGEYIAVSVSNQELVCFRTSDGQQAWISRTAGSPVSDFVWSRDNTMLVCAAQDGYLRIFDTGLKQMTIEYPLPIRDPIRVRLSPEEKWLYLLDRDGTLIRLPCAGSLR
jgi:serine/threonine protein kinase/dipeptidyl aminopeptidase/acylaminoacyl peptidase